MDKGLPLKVPTGTGGCVVARGAREERGEEGIASVWSERHCSSLREGDGASPRASPNDPIFLNSLDHVWTCAQRLIRARTLYVCVLGP